jgi:hypothetical protein
MDNRSQVLKRNKPEIKMKINHYKALFTSVLGCFSTPVQPKQNKA